MSTFQAEVEDHLTSLNKGLLTLEHNPSNEIRTNTLSELFRAAHSLKGAARTVGVKDIETIAHHLEDAFSVIRKNNVIPNAAQINILLLTTDMISEAMNAQLRSESIEQEKVKKIFEKLSREIPDSAAPAAETAINVFPQMLQQTTTPVDNSLDMQRVADQPGDPDVDIPLQVSPQLPVISPDPHLKPSPAETSGGGNSRPLITDETIRVSTSKLDTLMDSLGELMVARMRNEQMLDQVHLVQQRAIQWQKKWRNSQPQIKRLTKKIETQTKNESEPALAFLENNEIELKTLVKDLNAIIRRLNNDYNHLQLVSDSLQTGIRNIRMLPISTLFDIYPRMLRDLALERSKEVTLVIEGQDTEVDRQTLEMVKDPLTHLLRNALDHGIESPEIRLANGKPCQGTIRLSAEQRGSSLILTVSDDGKGIDLGQIKQTAIKQKLLTSSEAEKLNENEVLNFIFAPGFSTAREITDISGRGIGLDIVHTNLEQIHGIIHVTTQPHRGSAFILTLPLTLASNQVLIVKSGGEDLAFPMINVEHVLQVKVSQIGSLDGKPAIYTRGTLVPLVSLAQLVNLPEKEDLLTPDSKISVMILTVVEKQIALWVDGFVTTQEVVIKNLGRQIRRVKNVAGATILGDGQLVIILNPADLVKSMVENAVRPILAKVTTQQAPRKRRILVTDDSITTRMLEKNILENAGFLVHTAADGQEAWNFIKNNDKETPDLVVSDINMPNMDGFGLAETIKGDTHYNHIPIILVSSLESPEDKLHGLESGADAYIVKKSFDQHELLDMIDRLTR